MPITTLTETKGTTQHTWDLSVLSVCLSCLFLFKSDRKPPIAGYGVLEMRATREMIKVSPNVNVSRLAEPKARRAHLREQLDAARTSPQRFNNENVFQQKLESHLFDVKMSKPWRSQSIHAELKHRHLDNRDALADINPEALRMYVGLISGMGYRQQARLASSVFQMSQNLEELRGLGESLAKIKPMTQAEIAQKTVQKAMPSRVELEI